MSFIGRKKELQELRNWQQKKVASLVVIQAKLNGLYVCEIKFSRSEVGMSRAIGLKNNQ